MIVLINQLYIICFRFSYPYDEKEMPAYLITYVVQSIGFYFACMSQTATDCFYLAICWEIKACLCHLTSRISQIDEMIDQ